MSRILQPGQRVFTVSAFLVSNDEKMPRVLMLEHPKLGRWMQPGGHIEYNQDPVTALIAEFLDEVGIDLTPYLAVSPETDRVQILPLPAQLTSIRMPAGKPNPGDPEHFMIDITYLIRAPYQPVKPGVRAEWLSWHQLDSYRMPDDVRNFLLEVL
jgi:8-oxo-dGTP diphosphatase